MLIFEYILLGFLVLCAISVSFSISSPDGITISAPISDDAIA